MENAYEVPRTVRIFYEGSGQTHFFTSPELRGLLIGSPDLRLAFEQIPHAIEALVKAKCGAETGYRLSTTLDEFRLEAGRLRGLSETGPHLAFVASCDEP